MDSTSSTSAFQHILLSIAPPPPKLQRSHDDATGSDEALAGATSSLDVRFAESVGVWVKSNVKFQTAST